MIKLSKKAEELLKEILEHRLDNGNCDVSYWKERFVNLTYSDDMILRSLFKELTEHGMISVGWADDYPFILTVLGNGMFYFDEIIRDSESPHSTSYNNHFYGDGNNVIIQQGCTNSTQVISNDSLFFEQVKGLVELIKKYDAALDIEFGDAAVDLRGQCKELERQIEENNSKGRIKSIIKYIRDLSINVGGGLIAKALIELTTKLQEVLI